MSRLTGKIAVVTGGNSGIGLATAQRFAQDGAQVVIIGRRQKELDEAIALIGHEALAIQGDVSKLADLERIFNHIRQVKGKIDILFANAGLGELQPLGAITEASYEKTFGVNVKGTLFTVQSALPLMSDGGSIILTGSTAGSVGTPAFSVYSATKAAIRNFARSWSLDLQGTGIRVNVLSPGSTATPGLFTVLESSGEKENLLAHFSEGAPLGRIGDPDEIASVASFLASDDSSFMTGSEVFVDGGLAQI